MSFVGRHLQRLASVLAFFAWLAPSPLLAQTYKVLHAFERGDPLPTDSLLQGTTGTLYGVSQSGGIGNGALFKVEPDGSGYTVLHSFDGFDGREPLGSLVQGTDGALYGTTSWSNGAGNGGHVFSIQPDGSGFRTLAIIAQGSQSALVSAPDGTLYGTTTWGGDNNQGTVFKIKQDGSGLDAIHVFNGSDGQTPIGGLTLGPDGTLYGTTYYGGPNGAGVLFRLKGDGKGFAVLHTFGVGLFNPEGALALGPGGVLFGTTNGGYGGVYRINTDGSAYAALRTFALEDGVGPWSGLLLATDGLLYGTNIAGGPLAAVGTVYRMSPDGSAFTIVHPFSGTDGSYPKAGLIEGSDGLLYGCTTGRGARGALFRMAKDGSAFATFLSSAGIGGDEPSSGLVRGPDGTLYGTTQSGGQGFGSVFSVDSDGNGFSILHTFVGSDGAHPIGTLALLGGTLYGTTSTGGNQDKGAVFTLATDGSGFQVLHLFNGDDGESPEAGLLLASDGELYGTTPAGGASNLGTIYKTDTTGNFTLLHSLAAGEGRHPTAALIQGADGALYGTTTGNADKGTVFKVDPDGTGFTTLHYFTQGQGSRPYGRLVQSIEGALFGTTAFGGANDAGTAFRLYPDGTGFLTLHSFDSYYGEGLYPYTGLTMGGDGWLYGTTSFGGSLFDIAIPERGTLFRLKADGSGEFNSLLDQFSVVVSDGVAPTAAAIFDTATFVDNKKRWKAHIDISLSVAISVL